MKYMLLIYGNEADMPDTKEAATHAYKMSAGFAAYNEALKKAGVMVDGARLRPTRDATTVRVVGGKSQVLNGPYAETREQLGGYYLIDVPDLDAALSWAARCPAAERGTIEVRPLWPMA